MIEALEIYWSADALRAATIIILHLAGAFALGVLMGYERSYHGRAAGMRTYALVCMAASGLTVACAFPGLWFGRNMADLSGGDPTRIIQGIMTGIGFLGAGVIMREGRSIRGLSTAASIWMAAAIGVLVGMGYYLPAISAALMTTAAMTWLRRIEAALPHQALYRMTASFTRSGAPARKDLFRRVELLGFDIKDWSYGDDSARDDITYELTLQTGGRDGPDSLLAELERHTGLSGVTISPVRD